MMLAADALIGVSGRGISRQNSLCRLGALRRPVVLPQLLHQPGRLGLLHQVPPVAQQDMRRGVSATQRDACRDVSAHTSMLHCTQGHRTCSSLRGWDRLRHRVGPQRSVPHFASTPLDSQYWRCCACQSGCAELGDNERSAGTHTIMIV